MNDLNQDEINMKERVSPITFDPSRDLTGYPKESGMMILSADFNRMSATLETTCERVNFLHERVFELVEENRAQEDELDTLKDMMDEMSSRKSSYNISLSADDMYIKGDGKSVSRITAAVKDTKGAPAKGVKVSFATSAGELKTTKENTDAKGMAGTSLVSYDITDKNISKVRVTVTATCDGARATQTVVFYRNWWNRPVMDLVK